MGRGRRAELLTAAPTSDDDERDGSRHRPRPAELAEPAYPRGQKKRRDGLDDDGYPDDEPS